MKLITSLILFCSITSPFTVTAQERTVKKIENSNSNLKNSEEKKQRNPTQKSEKLRKKIAKNGKKKYMKYFNSSLVAEFIINKTLGIDNKKKFFWHN